MCGFKYLVQSDCYRTAVQKMASRWIWEYWLPQKTRKSDEVRAFQFFVFCEYHILFHFPIATDLPLFFPLMSSNVNNTPVSSQQGPTTTTAITPSSVASQDKTKCTRQGCKDSTPTVECCYEKCPRYMHLRCFQQLYESKGHNKLHQGKVVCTKKCYNWMLMKSKATRHPCWQTNGAAGQDDPNNLEHLLL